ncbi:MAG: mechanosensitive ion channel family protein [Paracoccaceae bacterium]|nr:MAG: mechanosensitive ion channel family protein [Paracoccaceae bacterium]
MRDFLRTRITAAAVAAALGLAAPGGIATAQTPEANVTPREAVADPAPQSEALDYAAWEELAARAEEVLEAGVTTPIALEQLRAQIADWRSAFLVAQGTNATRIATIRGQIDALGAPPTEGATEPDEIAARRRDLSEQLARAQAPVIAADEAYRRADGLIREIDRSTRDRQAAELTRLWPAPINPANWPAAVSAGVETAEALWDETAARAADPAIRRDLLENLPMILALLFVAVAMVWRGRQWFEGWPNRLRQRASDRGAEVWALLASLGQIVVPVVGVFAFVQAVLLSGLAGPQGAVAVASLTVVGFSVFAARWLGFRVFPKGEPGGDVLRLPADRRTEGRLAATALGFLLAVEALRAVLFDPLRITDEASAVLSFPGLALAAVLLFRIGQMLRQHVQNDTPQGEAASYRNRLIRIVGNAAMAVSVAGPALAAVGYVSAGVGMVYPAVVSLGLVALLFILQKLVRDIFVLIAGGEDAAREALIPVLIGFLLTLATLPLFALIWGARLSDLTEVFNRLREGFQIGQTRISPTNFLYFAVLFGVGFMMTRLFQGALKQTILPKTTLDQGGQNAVVAGVGYVGIFLAALIAINAAGIDLSGLAIVAGALSVGIGFGLQNIVSNFVSGIILLIERPVSEGDWIEVGGVQGTVRAISVRSTRIQTFDRTDVIVPNSDLIAGRVTNWTRFNLTGRLIVPVGVAYGTDTRRVAAILKEIAEAQPLAILNPPPMVTFMGFGADSLNFEIRMILRDINFGLSVRTEVNHQIAERFAKEGIEIPFAQRDIWLRNPEALAALKPAQAVPAQPADLPGAPETGLRPDPWPEDEASPEAPGEPKDRAG